MLCLVWKWYGTGMEGARNAQRNVNFEVTYSRIAKEGSGTGCGSLFQSSGSRSGSGWPFRFVPDQLH